MKRFRNISYSVLKVQSKKKLEFSIWLKVSREMKSEAIASELVTKFSHPFTLSSSYKKDKKKLSNSEGLRCEMISSTFSSSIKTLKQFERDSFGSFRLDFIGNYPAKSEKLLNYLLTKNQRKFFMRLTDVGGVLMKFCLLNIFWKQLAKCHKIFNEKSLVQTKQI